ncbi:hypothetical protein [Gemmatimonas sp.]|jgi:hypothetical protein|uniref:hypothetical protein n=1 Tax=Gemmatimonas sp. TaxID=1962908 RepID=UPI0037C1A874
MARSLAIVERHVGDDERADYLAALAARKSRAAAVLAHFWVFEHATERGRFVEFTEAASDAAIASLHGHDTSSHLWREVQGG